MSVFSKEVWVVALGGALGSVCRFLLSRRVEKWVPYENLPWGIITVNILGCLCIGVLYALFSYPLMTNPLWRAGLMIGILGGFTTFSSFSLDTVHLLQKGSVFLALSNVFISVVFCLLATAAGFALTRVFLP